MSSFDWHDWATLNGLEIARPGTEVEYLWVDIETTGLDPRSNVMLEFSAVLTDRHGAVVASPMSDIIKDASLLRPTAIMQMEPIVTKMHEASGLTHDYQEVRGTTPGLMAERVLSALRGASDEDANLKKVVMAGSTIGFDRFGYVQRDMPRLHQGIHYRSIDVSTIKTLAEKFAPQILRGLPTPRKIHRGLPDLVDSILEYRFYVDNFLFITGEN